MTDDASRPASPVDIAIVGTASAGKSTLINALLGGEIAATGRLATRGAIDLSMRGARRTDAPSLRAAELLARLSDDVAEGGIAGDPGIIQEVPSAILPRRGWTSRLMRVFPNLRGQGLRLRDTPGLVSTDDARRRLMIRTAVSAARVALVLFWTENTDPTISRALIEESLAGARASSASMVWALSRVDSFRNDECLTFDEAVERDRRQKAGQIVAAGGEMDAKGLGILSVSPRPAYLAAVLSESLLDLRGDTRRLRRWARQDLAAHCDLPFVPEPREIDGCLVSQFRACRALWRASGAEEIDRQVARFLSKNIPVSPNLA